MNLIKFYRDNVDTKVSDELNKALLTIESEMNLNSKQKCYLFSFANGHLFSHKFTHAETAISELNENKSVLLVSQAQGLRMLIISQVRETLPKVEVVEETSDYSVLRYVRAGSL